MHVFVFFVQSLEHWNWLWLSAGTIHLAGVILYDLFASGNLQPWDPSYGRRNSLLVKAESNVLPPQLCQQRQPQENDPLIATRYDDVNHNDMRVTFK